MRFFEIVGTRFPDLVASKSPSVFFEIDGMPLAFVLSQYIFGILFFIISTFLILLILVQRGRGGGLTGALGGAGGQSAFGTKAGDIFTRITVVTAALWIFTCALGVWWMQEKELPLGDTVIGTLNVDGETTGENTSPEAPAAETPAEGSTPDATTTPAITPAIAPPADGTPVLTPPNANTPAGTEGAPGTPALSEPAPPASNNAPAADKPAGEPNAPPPSSNGGQ